MIETWPAQKAWFLGEVEKMLYRGDEYEAEYGSPMDSSLITVGDGKWIYSFEMRRKPDEG